MEKSVVSGSSKVTVEYTDPSGVFPFIAHDLDQRLPLRNLHWDSSSRPLRSIKSLHIELVPDTKSVLQGSSAPPITGDSNQAKDDGLAPDTTSTSKSQAPASEEPRKERRHQIPGLRQTPYLKVYLLRCSDTESYKATSRKLLREWIKNHTPPSESSTAINKQENHDAFEWLIVHVVLPRDDKSASRLSGNPKTDSRWPTRISTSLIEKIKADFNGTSKSAIDRVGQVKATDSSDGSKIFSRPTPFVGQTTGEDHRGWDDLIAKLKLLILTSFDLRVRQYEEDIKEKESQRSLPGWNFNTFFLLKEGLARGFESVGLVEDALIGYHELAAGLNAVVGDRETVESPEQHTDLFRSHTDEVLEEFKQAALSEVRRPERDHDSKHSLVNSPQNPIRSHDFGASILDTDRKPFRELILANNISAFDFQCYVFARQISLLLRLANVISPEYSSAADLAMNDTVKEGNMALSAELVPNNSESQNLLLLADVCQRGVEFITSTACALRNDFRSSFDFHSRKCEDYGPLSKVQIDNVIENLVTSWTFSTSQSILRETSVQSLSDRLQPLLRQLQRKHHIGEDSYELPAQITDVVHQDKLPSRTSSLPSRTPTTNRSSSPEKFPSVTSLDAMRLLPPTSSQTGSQELAAQHAGLFLLSRRALSSLGLRIGGWSSGWADLASDLLSGDGDMENVSLNEDPNETRGLANARMHPKNHEPSTNTGIRSTALSLALSSQSAFYKAYEGLTASALGHYVLGERHKSAEGMTADIAAVRFYLEDYAAAASYFHQLAPFYAKNDWSHLETSVLETYAQCLKQLDRNMEYINIALQILAKTVQRHRTIPQHRTLERASGHLGDLIAASESLDDHISVPMDSYFRDIGLEPFLRHYESHDGFQLLLRFQNLMPETFEAHKIRVRITTVEKEPRYEIWLATEGVQKLEPGSARVLLGSNVILPAWYILDQIMIQSGNIVFTHDLSPPPSGPFFAGNHDTISVGAASIAQHARILVWAHHRALEASLSHCKSINLEHTRSLVVDIFSGWNNIFEGRVQLRAATAGLRLHTAEAELQDSDTKILDQSQPGSINFGEVSADTTMKIKVPYSLESDLQEIVIKIEIHYTTAEGNFIYACNPKLAILLLVGVNVQDIFKDAALFSKFTISTADSTPLRISNCCLEGTKDFEVATPPLADGELDVFARQPLSLVSKISRPVGSKVESNSDGQLERKLSLEIKYCRVDLDIMTAAEQSFSAALTNSPFQMFSRVLVPALTTGLRSRLSSQDLELIGMMREIDVGPFRDYDWDSIISGLSPGYRHELADWLQKWHKGHTSIAIPSELEASIMHYLTVPVEIPQMQVVHTIDLRLVSARTENQTESSRVAISHAVPAELTIKHTRKWGTLASSQDADKPLDFCYEIQASPELWLVGGQRKAHFSAREDESLSFPIILLPQKAGHLLLPSIDVRPSRPYGINPASENKRSSAIPLSSCETDYRNQGATVLVSPNLSSTTVSLDPHGSTSGAWLVESKSRHGPDGNGDISWTATHVVADNVTKQQYDGFGES